MTHQLNSCNFHHERGRKVGEMPVCGDLEPFNGEEVSYDDHWNFVVGDCTAEAQDEFNEDRGEAKDMRLFVSFRGENHAIN